MTDNNNDNKNNANTANNPFHTFANMGNFPQNPLEFFAQMQKMTQSNPFLQAFNPQMMAVYAQTGSQPNTTEQNFSSIASQNTSNQSTDQTPQPSIAAGMELFNQFTQNMLTLSQQIASQSLKMGNQPQHTNTSMMFDLMEGWRKIGNTVSSHPGAAIEEQMELLKNQRQLWQNTLLKMAGKNPTPITTPEKGDKRFADADWEANPLFDFLKQNYLLTSQAMMQSIENVAGIDEKTRQRLAFFTRQWINAIAPTNFLLTNPEVLKLTVESGGQNLVQGMKQLTEDMANSADTLNVRMTDHSAFRVGDNIAVSKGKVVFENHMMQLIQYEPATEKVKKRPLVLVPPWINKFYIMDLREKNSFIRWAVNEGHTVFVLSWANPTPAYKYVGMDTYMKDGVLAALDQVEAITGEKSVNITGYCIGGMLVSVTLAYLAATQQAHRIESATLWATIIDFADPGDIGVFIDDKIVTALDKQNDFTGVFDGRMMGMAFSMLRENSLYWNYYVQNYLKGERPVPFDLLYWNSDCTNVAAKLHHFLLKEFYLNNQLKVPNGIEIDGVKIDLSSVKTPVFMVATLQDHIAKWKGCYAGTQIFGGEKVFVLGESGHIAGIMNPPGSKYGYYRNPNYGADADTWYQQAQYVEDTWWTTWKNWVEKYQGTEIPARRVGVDTHGNSIATYGDAPGDYVLVKAEEALAGHNFAEAYWDLLPKQ